MKIKWQDEKIPHMNVKEAGEVTYLTYPAFEKLEGIIHGFSTRLGGVSRGIYSSMNLSFTRGDEEEAVKENYRRIAQAIGFRTDDIVTSDQTHTANVRKVTEADRGKGITVPRDYQDVDGMVTNVPGLVLTTFYADCVTCDRSFSLWLARDCCKDRKSNCREDERGIWMPPGRYSGCNRPVYLPGLL